MRAIKFRGKSVADGVWIFGSLYTPTAISDKSFIFDEDGNIVEVIPSSVGQFTGLTDKKGKDIFEGDVVLERLKCNRKDGDPYEIIFEDCQWFGKNSYGNKTGLSLLYDFHILKIIGNIHDNPELLNK